MKTTRKRYSADFKAKVALEAIRGDLTLAELGAKHGIHHTMIAAWKRQAIDGMASTFVRRQDIWLRSRRRLPECGLVQHFSSVAAGCSSTSKCRNRVRANLNLLKDCLVSVDRGTLDVK
jgi:transposase-like protein